MFRLIKSLLILVVLGFASAVLAQQGDHNRGLVLKGSLYAWKTTEIQSLDLRSDGVWPGFVALLEMELANNGDEPLLVPRRLGCFAEIRFMAVGGAGDVNTEVVHPVESPFYCRLPYLQEKEPRGDYFKVVEPGESFRFAEEFRICAVPENKRDAYLKGLKDVTLSKLSLETVWKSTHLKFRYRGWAGDGKDPELLRNTANRWERYGVFPLNDDGEFTITSQPIPANIDWLKLEDRK